MKCKVRASLQLPEEGRKHVQIDWANKVTINQTTRATHSKQGNVRVIGAQCHTVTIVQPLTQYLCQNIFYSNI